jgi:photosystem II stability/assembly factor-like uncharacterized protein
MADRDISGTALDVRLARGRAELLESIDQPPLDLIRERAATRRRRRRAATAGGGVALLLVTLGAGLAFRPGVAGDVVPPPVADRAVEPPPGGPVYTGAGITINGLTEPGVAYVPGAIADVEFVDPDHGYVLTLCPATAPCPATVARTADGGLTWQYASLPADSAGRPGLGLAAVADGRLLVTGDGPTYVSTDHGHSWRAIGSGDGTGPVTPTTGDSLRAGPGGGCGYAVELWRPDLPRAGTTPSQPDLDVCWVATAASPDGAWWAGGFHSGRPAVAVTRDLGTTWRTVTLPEAPSPAAGTVEVASLGSHAYAVVLDADRTVRALYHAADGGRTFRRVGAQGGPERLAGAMVPLLDGRLLVTGTDQRWYVSSDDGATFAPAGGSLPDVGRLARTTAGYVAYDLFGTGWAAYSADGATWRKLQIN